MFLLLIIILIGYVLISRNINHSKIDKIILTHKTHSKLSEVYSPARENIGFIKRKINEGYIYGFHHIPNDFRHDGVIITLGGSDGNIDNYMSNYMSSDGYEVISLAYFGEEGQPQVLERVPLEFYEEIYSYIKENCKNTDTITILASSKGAELALILSTYYDSIDNLVLFAPISYIDKSNELNEVSPWTYKGKELEYINGKLSLLHELSGTIDILMNRPHNQIKWINSRIKNSTNLEASRIKTENSNAKILIFYGEDDGLINAKEASTLIKKYTKNEIIIHNYKNVGHSFEGPPVERYEHKSINFGGDINSNIEAALNSKKIILETLELWHK